MSMSNAAGGTGGAIGRTIPLDMTLVTGTSQKASHKGKQKGCGANQKKKVEERQPYGTVQINNVTIYLFSKETYDNYEFLKQTNKVLELAAKCRAMKKDDVSDDDFMKIVELTKVTRDNFIFETQSMNKNGRVHLNAVLAALDETIDYLK